MSATLSLIDLAGAIALLLWGLHMVQSGIQRAFGPNLRRFLGRALGDRLRAFAAGIGGTALLPTNTPPRAVAGSFSARGRGGPGAAFAVSLRAHFPPAPVVGAVVLFILRGA